MRKLTMYEYKVEIYKVKEAENAMNQMGEPTRQLNNRASGLYIGG